MIEQMAGCAVSRLMAATLWKIRGSPIDLTQHGIIMGVLNVTPDSFSDGGENFDHGKAVEHALRMVREGAGIIDVGGESTRPGATLISAEEEISRVLPVVETLAKKTAAMISIDTSKAAVAKAALEVGAAIVNDITGGRDDAEMFRVVASTQAGFIIMHMQGTPATMQADPQYSDLAGEVAEFFRQQYERAVTCGIDPMSIAFDPGIGFGKTPGHNLELIAKLDRLSVHDRPLVVGVSRKGFLARFAGSDEMGERLWPTVACTAVMRERGARVIRVHDVAPNVAALKTTEAILDCMQ